MSNKYKQYAEKIIKMTPEELKQEDKRLRDKLGMNQKELPPWLFRQISDNAFAFSESLRTAEEKMWAQSHFTIGANSLAPQLVEAQERIKNIEKGIGDLIADMEGWRKACIDDMKRVEFNEDRSIGYDLNGRSKAEFDGILPRLKALSPNNKQKEDGTNM